MKRIWWILLLMVGCGITENESSIDIQGHRGARGLAPENSLEAFILAVKMGVKTLELDLVVSKDGKLVISHEPYFSPDFCLDTLGNEISDSLINIYQLRYEDIQKFDCGSKRNRRFPEQETFPTVKPLLSSVLDSVETFVIATGRAPLYYNIELKTSKETDLIFHPKPEVFSDLVFDLITEKNLWDKVNVQSFDFRTLQYFNRKYPNVRLALLIENELSWKDNIDSLGFTPEIYSCYYKLLESNIVEEIQKAGMLVVPWTVNEVSDLKNILELGVDGIITDYPDRALNLISKE